MTGTLLRLAAQGLLFAPAAVSLVVGVLAVRAMAGARLKQRPERWAAVAIAAVAGLGVGALFELYVASFAGLDSDVTLQSYLTVLPIAAIVAGLSLLAGFSSYVIVARVSVSRASAAGAFIGAPLLVAIWYAASLGSLGLQNAAYDADAAAAAGVIADRSAAITMRTELLEATMDAQGTGLATVRVRVILKSDRGVAFETGSKTGWPRFTFTNVGQNQLQVEGSAADPQVLESGTDEVWNLTFSVPPLGPYSGTYQVPTPGTWPLAVTFLDSAGAEYNLSSDVNVQPTH